MTGTIRHPQAPLVRQLLSTVKGDEPMLLLLNSGFFLYAMRDGKCTDIAAPRVDLFPHVPRLGFPQSAIVDVTGGLTSYIEKDLMFFDIARLAVSVVRALPGAAAVNHSSYNGDDDPDFNWVTDFTWLCSGVRLKPDWMSSRGIDSRVALAGGNLVALPDSKSLLQKWQWTVGGVTRTQRVTTFTGYGVPFPSLTLRFDTLDGVPVGAVRLRAAQFPQLPELPPLVAASLECTPAVEHPDPATVGHAHTHAFLSLCEPTGDPIALATPKTVGGPAAAVSGGGRLDAQTDIDLVLEHIASKISPFWDGTPECSGHQMSV